MKWLHRDRGQQESPIESPRALLCEHIVLVPRWDRADDVGREERASGYRCETCGANLARDAALHLRATEAARVLRRVSA